MIKIKAKKVIYEGRRMYKITSISALRLQDLPAKYLKGHPHCYLANGHLIIRPEKNTLRVLEPGTILEPKEMADIWFELNRCGKCLRSIHKELRKDWHGEITLKI